MKKILIAAMMMPAVIYAQDKSTITADVGISTEVPVYEYVPKVIIEGKWGKREGKFGRQGEVDYDLKPESMAVDSRGNIYILDFVNNRIQKFNKNGEYLKSIEIEGLKGPIYCWAQLKYNPETKQEERYIGDSPEKPAGVPEEKLIPYIWPPEVQGINIVIDSKDTLYYYLKKKGTGDSGQGTETEIGEVWDFKGDKLVKKWEVPVNNLQYYEGPSGLNLEEDDSIWIFNILENGKKTKNQYEVKTRKKYTIKEREEALIKGKEKKKSEGISPLTQRRIFDLQIAENGVIITKDELVRVK